MRVLFLFTIIFLTSNTGWGQKPAKFYDVFRTDNEHCFAIDAKRTIYRIDDVDFKCSPNAQPNPDKLVAIEKRQYLGDVVPAENAAKLKDMVMGNIVDLSGVKNNIYLYRTAKGAIDGQPVFENYFVNTDEVSEGKFRINVSVLRFEYDNETGARTNRLGTNYQNIITAKLEPVPSRVQEVLAQEPEKTEASGTISYPYISEGKIEAREIPVLNTQGSQVATIVTEEPPAKAPIFTEVSVEPKPSPTQAAAQPQTQILLKYEKEYCSDIFKRYGRKLANQDCSQLKEEKFSQRCLLDKHCNFEKNCDSLECVNQYKELGALEDITSLMRQYEKMRSKLNKAAAAFKSAEKNLTDCDSLDKNAEERKQKAEAVEKARKAKASAQKSYNDVREKLDRLVQAKIESSADRYACVKYSPATFRYFYDSWIYILDYQERYWTCVLGPRAASGAPEPAKAKAAQRAPSATKQKQKKK